MAIKRRHGRLYPIKAAVAAPFSRIAQHPEARVARRILVPTDGSAGAKAAVDAAVGLARDAGASVVGLHVAALASMLNEDSDGAPDPEGARLSRACLGYLEQRASQAGVPAELVTRRADAPSQAILAAVRALQCYLIAMGAHGTGADVQRILGSQTMTVLAHCSVPVLVVPLRQSEA